MALKIGKGWHGDSYRHGLAAKGIKTGRTSKTPMLSPKVSGYAKRFSEGVRIESKEHPKLSESAVEGLVRDHLDENPNYYSNPNSKEEKYERCVKKVKKQKRVKSPQAVCRASVYRKSRFDVAREERRKGIIK